MPGTWDARRAAAVAIGGAAGAVVRWAVVTSLDAGSFPWPVLAVNVVGSFLLGVFMAEELTHSKARLLLHDLGGIGFCGGLTTFSTFALEVVDLTRDGSAATAALYTLVSITAAIVAVLAGATAMRQTRALTLPVEEQP